MKTNKDTTPKKTEMQFKELSDEKQITTELTKEEMIQGRRKAEEAEEYPVSEMKELIQENIPELNWIVEGLLPEGLAILVGKPKAGKSWLALQLCASVVEGRDLFEGFTTNKSSVLYMALEDSKRRLKSRTEKQQGTIETEGFYYATAAPPFKKGGKEWLRRSLEQHAEIKLIVIDTMGRHIHFDNNGKNDYETTYKLLTELQDITREFNVAILLVHHMRKDSLSEETFDSILGSTAIGGVMDTMFALKRKNENFELAVTGRDLEEETYIVNLNKTTCNWEMKGKAKEYLMTENQRKILYCLEDGNYRGPKEISEETEIKNGTVKPLLRKMYKAGLIEQDKGKYKKKET